MASITVDFQGCALLGLCTCGYYRFRVSFLWKRGFRAGRKMAGWGFEDVGALGLGFRV